jgi:hypothetical protein
MTDPGRRRFSVAITLFLLVLMPAVGSTDARAELPHAAAAEVARRVAGAIDCRGATDPLRAWCAVASLGTASYAAPAAPVVHLGISLAFRQGNEVRSEVLKTTHVSALVAGPAGVSLVPIRPENAKEKQDLASVAAQLALQLKQGSFAPVPVLVSSGLRGFLDGLAARSGRPVRLTPNGGAFTASLPARIYSVTYTARSLRHAYPVKAYVVLEQATDGIWVSVFPQSGYR